MASLEDLFDFFKGANKKGEVQRTVSNEAFVEHFLQDGQLQQTLDTLDRVLASEAWGAEEGIESFYENPSLDRAIQVAREAKALETYMSDENTYAGAELNEDVLKTVLQHFLSAIEPYEFYAFLEDVSTLYDKVVHTPTEMLKYIIEERGKKLEKVSQENVDQIDVEFAKRILELDLMLQLQRMRQGKAIENAQSIERYASLFAERVHEKYRPAVVIEEPQDTVDAEPEDSSSSDTTVIPRGQTPAGDQAIVAEQTLNDQTSGSEFINSIHDQTDEQSS